MSDIIQLLPDHVANQIAAGEVVQRPASVVKELLENAIDAGGTEIQLIVKEAGKTLIQVIDNGIGMSPTDARMSFERHATSKIQVAEDLFQLNTKGFRGEALASIAAIAHVELKTKPREEELGTAITIEGSLVKSQEVTVTPTGTSLAVKNLFFNIPARRNFLKSNAVELRHIVDEFHRVALAHPEVAFSFFHNDSELFSLPKSNHRQRVVHIFGTKTNERLVPVSEATEVLNIEGFIGKPEYARKTRSEQFFFVNRRYIKSAYLNHAVVAAFEGLLKEGYYPSYFLNLTVDPKSIDINIHPTKTEIKFEDEHTLYALLRSAVKHSLGQFNIAPVLDFNKDASLDTPYNYKDRQVSNPRVEVDRSFNPFADEQIKNTSSGITGRFQTDRTKNAPWEALYTELNVTTDPEQEGGLQSFESKGINPELFEGSQASIEVLSYQIQGKYIVKPLVSGILIVDQNRAHQRVLYEKFLKQLTVKSAVSQQLLFPVTLDFSKPEMVLISSMQSDLEEAGFVFEKVLDDGLVLKGIPAIIPEAELSLVFEQLISDVEHQVPEQNFSSVDLMAKSLAKSLAIKTGQELTNTEQMHLVDSLFACKESNLSPTGQLAYYILEPNDIEKKFK
jgi:DNA mismatch repair protein MutL